MQDHLSVCQRAAKAGGRVLLDWIGRFGVREKGPSDLVTEADLASQEAVRHELLAAFPDYGFVSEESEAERAGMDRCWVVDPLDGTTNYVHQMPHYAVSIALVEHNVPRVATVYDPVRDECFSAVRGSGATLNERRIRASGVQELAQALVAASFSAKVTVGSVEIDQFVAAVLHAQAVRRTGSAALNLAYVAAGRFDAFWAVSTKPWDVAAGVLLVEEAGGVVSRWDGEPLDLAEPYPLASATRPLHLEFSQILKIASHAN